MTNTAVDAATRTWTEPAVNWLDYFVDKDRIAKLLEGTLDNEKKEALGHLAIQFAEQAQAAEKEAAALVSKQFPQEDVAFSEYKAAFLWLCSQLLLTRLDWDFEFLIEKFKEPIQLLAVVELVNKWAAEQEARDASLNYSAGWARWLAQRFTLAIHAFYRLPPPPVKQTVSNPMTMQDAALLKAAEHKKCVSEIMATIPQLMSDMDAQLKEKNPPALRIPDVECFLVPFTTQCNAALNVAMTGPNVLVATAPRPDFRLKYKEIPAVHVMNRMRYDLMRLSVVNGEWAMAKKLVKQFAGTNAKDFEVCGPVAVDLEVLNAYRSMFQLAPIEGVAQKPSTSTQPDPAPEEELQQLIASPRPPWTGRVSQVKCWAQEQKALATRTKIPLVVTLNAIKALTEENPSIYYIRASLVAAGRDALQAFAAVSVDLLRKTRPEDAALIRAVINYLSVTVPGFSDLLTAVGIDKDTPPMFKRKYAEALKPVRSFDVPSKQLLQAFLQPPADPEKGAYWTILTSTNAAELKQALAVCSRDYSRPLEFKFPEILADTILRGNPVNEYHAILLAKLEQLNLRKNDAEWNERLNEYCKEFGELIQDPMVQMRIIYETLRVKTEMWNRRMGRAWAEVREPDVMRHLQALKQIFNDSTVLAQPNTTSFIIQALAFFMNMNEFDFLLQRFQIPNNRPMVVCRIAKMLAMYGRLKVNGENLQAMLQGLFSIMNQAFESRPRGSREGLSYREKKEVLQLIQLIKEPMLVSLMIAYLSTLYNALLAATQRSQFKLTFEDADGLFKPDIRLPDLSQVSRELVEDALSLTLQNALLIQANNPHWLKTDGDFELARENTTKAISRYLEVLLSVKPDLRPPYPIHVIDDLFWRRVRMCLTRQGLHHLAALVTQMISGKRTEDYKQDAETIRSATMVLDASDDYASLIFDPELAEMLANHYESTGQRMKQAHLLSELSKQCVNQSNSAEILEREKSRRIQRLVQSLAALFFDLHV